MQQMERTSFNHDSKNTYGTVSRLLHWSIFVGYILIFGTAFAAKFNPEMKFLMQPHQTIGIAILVLSVARVLWAAMNSKNRAKEDLKMKLGHFALYALMLLVPILGMVRKFGKENGNQMLVDLGNNFHGELGMVILLLIVGHVAMVIIHQMKGEKTMEKMLGRA